MGVDAGGWPSNVAANELIESAWGNAVVKGLLHVPILIGSLHVAPHIQGAIGAVADIPASPAVNYPTTMLVRASVWIASDTSPVGGATGNIATGIGGATNQPVTPPVSVTSGPGAYALVSLVWRWAIPALGANNFGVQAQWTTASGAIYTVCDVTWQLFRA
jgi:hypothetical protein